MTDKESSNTPSRADTENPERWEKVLEFLKPKPPLYCPETPSLKQNIFLRFNGREALFGGSAGGGKSSALLMAALQYTDVPDYSAIIFRKTYADLALPGAIMDRFVQWMSEYEDVRWNSQTHTATFPSGARISFGYLNNPNDHLRYQGFEAQFAGFDEVTHLRESQYLYIASRLRKPAFGPLASVPLRMRAASNPAPNWVRQRFLVEGSEHGAIFVPARLDDNPGVDKVSYRQTLAMLSPLERRQLEDGDWWASIEGSLFRREDFPVIGSDEMPVFDASTKFVRYWDLAATEESESNKNPDWTVGTLMAFHKGQAFVMDVQRARLKPNKVEELVQQTALQDGKMTPIRMEQEGGSSGKIAIDNFARNVLPGFDFDGIRPSGDKQLRATPMASASSKGNVILCRAAWNGAWLDELTSFPEVNDHDDQVDSASGAFNFIADLGFGQKSKLRIIL